MSSSTRIAPASGSGDGIAAEVKVSTSGRWSMAARSVAAVTLGTGRHGSCTSVSWPGRSGGSSASNPSRSSIAERPVPCRNSVAPSLGHAAKSRQRRLPMSNIRTAGAPSSGASFNQRSNQAICTWSMRPIASAPKSCAPMRRPQGKCAHGPTTSRAGTRPASARNPASVPGRCESNQPPMNRQGVEIRSRCAAGEMRSQYGPGCGVSIQPAKCDSAAWRISTSGRAGSGPLSGSAWAARRNSSNAAASPASLADSAAICSAHPTPACRQNAPPSYAQSVRTSHPIIAGASARNACGARTAASNWSVPWYENPYMPTRPLLPGKSAAQATASAPSSASFSSVRNTPSDVPRTRTSWIATI